MTRKQKHLLTRILVAAVLFLAGSLLHLPEYVEMGVFLVCYAVVGWDIVWKAITNMPLHQRQTWGWRLPCTCTVDASSDRTSWSRTGGRPAPGRCSGWRA